MTIPTRTDAWSAILRAAGSSLATSVRIFVTTSPLWIIWAAPHFLGHNNEIVPYYREHLGLVLLTALPVVFCLVYAAVNYQRTHPPKTRTGRPKREPQPRLRPLRQIIRDSVDILVFLDRAPWRVIYLAGLAAAIILPTRIHPASVETFTALQTITKDSTIIEPVLLALAGPVGFYAIVFTRIAMVIRHRSEAIDLIYAIARDTLKYPKGTPKTNPTKRQIQLCTPYLAIDVKKWRGLYEVDEAFVLAPEELSVEDVDKWDEFDVNLNAKAPREEEWRVQRDSRGRGAKIGAANYPTAILWDGEYDPDPLTFRLGENLETGDRQVLTLNDVSPMIACSGGTSSGKSSAAEIMAAQVLLTPMPWDPDLRGMVAIVDPKGPFARRWRGRPGVVVADGQVDAAEPDEDGNPITGPTVMAQCMEWLEEEHQRRATILAKYPDVGTWIDLPDEIKKKEQFYPILIVLDEYIDHTDNEKSNGDERIERENDARNTTTRLASWQARKVRNVGMHLFVIAQRVNMSIIGNVLMTNLPVRIVTGQMDDAQMRTMFQTDDIPSLPATRVVVNESGERLTKTIPGRARIMNAIGQQIHKVQIMWFGGKSNSDTLDKWLPRGEAPPNGDFSLPTGRPRTPDDFDADGNLLADETPVVAAATEVTEIGEGDADGDGIPDGAPTTSSPLPNSADESNNVSPATPADNEQPDLHKVSPDLDPVFPAATAVTPSCAHDGCVNDAARTCTGCQASFCEYHLTSSPDPDERELACDQCAANHPLVVAKVVKVYQVMHEMGREAGLVTTYKTSEDSEVVATTRTPRNKKVVEVIARDGTITGRSRSGMVTGDEVQARVEQVITTYIDRKRATHATGEGETS